MKTSTCGIKSRSGKRPPTYRNIVLEFNRQDGWNTGQPGWTRSHLTWSPVVPHLCCVTPEPELAGYTCLAPAKLTLQARKEDKWRPRPPMTPSLLTRASFSSKPLDRLLLFKFRTCHTHTRSALLGVCVTILIFFRV